MTDLGKKRLTLRARSQESTVAWERLFGNSKGLAEC